MDVIERLRDSLERVVGPKGVISEPSELRTYECDGLAGYRVTPALVALPTSTAEVAQCRGRLPPGKGPVRRPWRGHRPVRWSAAGRRRYGDLAAADAGDDRGRPRQPACGRRARCHQPRDQPGGRGARPLLRARPLEPAGLHDRRERGRERRRSALPEVRLHDATTSSRWRSCSPTGAVIWLGGAVPGGGRPATCAASWSARRARSRSPPNRRTPAPQARDRQDPARGLPHHRAGR